MAGPAMPMQAFSVAIIKSLQPANTALPAKQRPDTTAMRGTRPLRRAYCRKLGPSRPATLVALSVSPGRPPPPSAKKITGSFCCSAMSRMRSVFLWFMVPWVPARTV